MLGRNAPPPDEERMPGMTEKEGTPEDVHELARSLGEMLDPPQQAGTAGPDQAAGRGELARGRVGRRPAAARAPGASGLAARRGRLARGEVRHHAALPRPVPAAQPRRPVAHPGAAADVGIEGAPRYGSPG